MEINQYLLVFAMSILGVGLAFLVKGRASTLLPWALSFTGSYVMGITMLHLLPGVFFKPQENIGIWILVGFFVQLLLEQLSRGVEHGHIHELHGNERQRQRMAVQVMLGLSIHALLEGMPLGSYAAFHADIHGHAHGHSHLLWGVVLHKLPEAFSLAILLRISNLSATKFWVLISFYLCMTPMGTLLVTLYQPSLAQTAILLALVVGSLLHIATTIIFEMDNSKAHHISWQKMLAIAAGVGLSLLTL